MLQFTTSLLGSKVQFAPPTEFLLENIMAVLTPKSGMIGMNKKSALKSSSPYFTFKLISFKLKDHVRLEFWQF